MGEDAPGKWNGVQGAISGDELQAEAIWAWEPSGPVTALVDLDVARSVKRNAPQAGGDGGDLERGVQQEA